MPSEWSRKVQSDPAGVSMPVVAIGGHVRTETEEGLIWLGGDVSNKCSITSK